MLNDRYFGLIVGIILASIATAGILINAITAKRLYNRHYGMRILVCVHNAILGIVLIFTTKSGVFDEIQIAKDIQSGTVTSAVRSAIAVTWFVTCYFFGACPSFVWSMVTFAYFLNRRRQRLILARFSLKPAAPEDACKDGPCASAGNSSNLEHSDSPGLGHARSETNTVVITVPDQAQVGLPGVPLAASHPPQQHSSAKLLPSVDLAPALIFRPYISLSHGPAYQCRHGDASQAFGSNLDAYRSYRPFDTTPFVSTVFVLTLPLSLLGILFSACVNAVAVFENSLSTNYPLRGFYTRATDSFTCSTGVVRVSLISVFGRIFISLCFALASSLILRTTVNLNSHSQRTIILKIWITYVLDALTACIPLFVLLLQKPDYEVMLFSSGIFLSGLIQTLAFGYAQAASSLCISGNRPKRSAISA